MQKIVALTLFLRNNLKNRFQSSIRFLNWLSAVAVLSAALGCQTIPPPIEEYTLARSAIEAAKSVQAAHHSPGYWHQAEEAYRKAKIHYNDHEWENARDEFVKARIAAEKAENSARAIRQKTGEVL